MSAPNGRLTKGGLDGSHRGGVYANVLLSAQSRSPSPHVQRVHADVEFLRPHRDRSAFGCTMPVVSQIDCETDVATMATRIHPDLTRKIRWCERPHEGIVLSRPLGRAGTQDHPRHRHRDPRQHPRSTVAPASFLGIGEGAGLEVGQGDGADAEARRPTPPTGRPTGDLGAGGARGGGGGLGLASLEGY